MKELTTTQRQAIREINDKGANAQVHARTMASLRQRGLVDANGYLTIQGTNAHHNIMSSGNGPEGLKAMFRLV